MTQAEDRADDAEFALSYALAKQLSTAYCIETNYGSIAVDHEMRKAIDVALRPILTKRLQLLQPNAGAKKAVRASANNTITRALTAAEKNALDAFQSATFDKFRGKFSEFEAAMQQYRDDHHLTVTRQGVRALVAR